LRKVNWLEQRRTALTWLASLPVSTVLQAQPKETFLPTPASLREAALAAQSKGEPLVLLVSLPGCVWCELLRRSYLAPMRNEGVQLPTFKAMPATAQTSPKATKPSSHPLCCFSTRKAKR
jgi:hypothetical protein